MSEHEFDKGNTAWRVWNMRVRPFWLTDDDINLMRDADVRAMERLGIGRWSLP